MLFATLLTMDVDTVSEEFQMELVKLQSDTILKNKYAEICVLDFYQYFPKERFTKLLSSSFHIITMFESTHVCEQFFNSFLKIKMQSDFE